MTEYTCACCHEIYSVDENLSNRIEDFNNHLDECECRLRVGNGNK